MTWWNWNVWNSYRVNFCGITGDFLLEGLVAKEKEERKGKKDSDHDLDASGIA